MTFKNIRIYFLLIIYQMLNLGLSQASLNIKSPKSCLIISYENIYISRGSSEIQLEKSIKNTTCPKIINSMFLNLIKNAQGSFSTKNFKRIYLPKEIATKVIIKPDQINISNFGNLITKIELPENFFLKKVNKNNELSILTLNEGEEISLSCKDCNSTGKKEIIIKVINSEKNIKDSKRIHANLLTRSQIVVPKKNIDYFNNKKLFKDDFSKKWIKTINPGKYFKSFNKIIFFKPTKTLKKGVPLLKRDLVPLKLVRSFTPVKIILSSKGIKLSGIAIAKKGGHYGELIPLRKKKGKRIIFGKIIDFNKVKIEI